MGRFTWLEIMMTLKPRSFTAYVASSMASSGVYTGTTAAGAMRSLYGANISAFIRFGARDAAADLRVGVVDVKEPERGVEQAEVHAEVVEPLVEELRHRSEERRVG